MQEGPTHDDHEQVHAPNIPIETGHSIFAHVAPSDKTPFPARDVFSVDDGPEMFTLREQPNIVVRKEKLRLRGISDAGPTSTKTLDYIAAGKNIFQEMREKYGVAVPAFQYVLGERDADGEPWLYTMTEKITGTDLSKVESFEGREVELVDKALSGAVAQLSDSYKRGEQYWIDIDVSQFMLGRRDNEEGEEVYLVDLEPRVGKWWGNQGEVLAKIHNLLEGVESIEARGKGEKLMHTRAHLRELFGQLHEPDPKDTYSGEPLLGHYQDLARRL